MKLLFASPSPFRTGRSLLNGLLSRSSSVTMKDFPLKHTELQTTLRRGLASSPSSVLLARTLQDHSLPVSSFSQWNLPAARQFNSEPEYHTVADETLDTILDAVEEVLESSSVDFETELANGVLTLKLPPKGSWVINKQTPNQQIWWSSPLSGPKRFEYDETDHLWFSTKDGLSLGPLLVQEMRHVHPTIPADFQINV